MWDIDNEFKTETPNEGLDDLIKSTPGLNDVQNNLNKEMADSESEEEETSLMMSTFKQGLQQKVKKAVD